MNKPNVKSATTMFKTQFPQYKDIPNKELAIDAACRVEFDDFKSKVYPKLRDEMRAKVKEWKKKHDDVKTIRVVESSSDDEEPVDDDAFYRLAEMEDGDDMESLKIAFESFKSFESAFTGQIEDLNKRQKELRTMLVEFKRMVEDRQKSCSDLFQNINKIAKEMIKNKKARMEEEE